MIEALIFVGIVGTSVLFILYGELSMVSEYPKNPLRWAQERRRRINRREVRRISALEHDLGYKPCSDSECWSCGRYIERVDTTIIDLNALDNSFKGAYTTLWDKRFIPDPPIPNAMPSIIRRG